MNITGWFSLSNLLEFILICVCEPCCLPHLIWSCACKFLSLVIMFYTWLVFYVYSHYLVWHTHSIWAIKAFNWHLSCRTYWNTFTFNALLWKYYVKCTYSLLTTSLLFGQKLHSYFFPQNKIISWEMNHHSIIQLLTIMQSESPSPDL